MDGVDRYEDLYAICDHMPGSDRELRVGGMVVFRTGGWSARLEPHNGPGGINERLLQLDLVLTPPDPGSGVTKVLTPVALGEHQIDDPGIEYDEVNLLVVGSGDEAPPAIKVEHPE